MRYLHTRCGLSLMELMIALVLSSVILASMYGAFIQQQRVSTQQEQLIEARQSARLTLDTMIQELRSAGFDPGGEARAGIVQADATRLRFTRDLNCNGTLASTTPGNNCPDSRDEDIAYELDPDEARQPRGLPLCTPACLGRAVHSNGERTGGLQPVASNILRLDFCYFLSADLSQPCVPAPGDTQLGNIRAVQIMLTVKASAPDPHYTDQGPDNAREFPEYRHYRKATVASIVHFRNLGVNSGPTPLEFDDPCPLPNPPPQPGECVPDGP